MAVNNESAQSYVDSSKPDVASLLPVARALINDYVGTAPVPEVVMDLALKTLVQELALRQRSPGGITNFGGETMPTRVNRDPMTPVYPILRPWAGGLA